MQHANDTRAGSEADLFADLDGLAERANEQLAAIEAERERLDRQAKRLRGIVRVLADAPPAKPAPGRRRGRPAAVNGLPPSVVEVAGVLAQLTAEGADTFTIRQVTDRASCVASAVRTAVLRLRDLDAVGKVGKAERTPDGPAQPPDLWRVMRPEVVEQVRASASA